MSTHGQGLRAKVQAHRDKLRRMGLRPIQIWVPDVRSPRFAAEARRQSLAVAHGAHARRDQLFIDRIAAPLEAGVLAHGVRDEVSHDADDAPPATAKSAGGGASRRSALSPRRRKRP